MAPHPGPNVVQLRVVHIDAHLLLFFPRDLEAWARWEASHHRLRRAKAAVVETLRTAAGRRRPSTEVISTYGSAPRIFVVVDAPTASQRSTLLAPVEHLGY